MSKRYKVVVTIVVDGRIDTSPELWYDTIEEAMYRVHQMTDPSKYDTMPHRDSVGLVTFSVMRMSAHMAPPTGVSKH